MAESGNEPSSSSSCKIVELAHHVEEGTQIGSKDYRFSKIGQPVPIKPGPDSNFDIQSPPLQPIAVSERFGALFVAHSTGFCVAKTKEVVQAAKEIKDKGKITSIVELSVLDVDIGKVSILALSADSSKLAVCVGCEIHFFTVAALLDKEQNPSFSSSVSDSTCIKDMRWTSKSEDQYVVLSRDGTLYRGAGQDGLKHVMDNVDAVEWSVKGKFLAIAKKNVLSIFTSKFEEKVQMLLSFDSWVQDSDQNRIVKVDCMRWVRPDCIILGCYQLTDDGKEESYLVQVITSKDGNLIDSPNTVVLTFSDVFLCLNDDALPCGSGPHMILSYFGERELAFISNRKNTDQHIVLFGWSLEEEAETAMIEILNDLWVPRIDLQDNEDDNMIMGLSIDKFSHDENAMLVLGDIEKEVSPCCILLCLTVDGKLSMFHFASGTDPSVLPDISEEEDNPSVEPSGSGMFKLSNLGPGKTTGEHIFGSQSEEVKLNQTKDEGGDENPIRNENIAAPQILEGGAQEVPLVRDLSKLETLGLPQQRSSDGFISEHPGDVSSKGFGGPLPKDFKLDLKLPVPKGTTGLDGASSESHSSGVMISSKVFDGKSSSGPFTSRQGYQPDATKKTSPFSVATSQNVFHSKQTSNTSSSTTLTVQKSSTGVGTTSSLSGVNNKQSLLNENNTTGKLPGFKFQPDKGMQKTHPRTRLLNSETSQSRHIGSVEEMANELDALLECIEEPGGFIDASITLQEESVAALEQGIWMLSDRCRTWTEIIDQRLEEIQLLHDKRVQVLARKVYMEGLVKQAKDSQYWDLWNRQKLSSELQMKHQNIHEVNQNLTNRLIELERHLNTVELQRFGQNNIPQVNRRYFDNKHVPSRHVQSLHSLHNTTSAQLAAAEKLSECLSKQMSVLSIETASANKQTVKKQLFDTIGISYDDDSFVSRHEEKLGEIVLQNKISISSCSTDSRAPSTRHRSSAVKKSEPETARRRRDSLDRNWASFEPSRTTVKRTQLQEEHQVSPGSLPLLNGKEKASYQLSEVSAARNNQASNSSTGKAFGQTTNLGSRQQAPGSVLGVGLRSGYATAQSSGDGGSRSVAKIGGQFNPAATGGGGGFAAAIDPGSFSGAVSGNGISLAGSHDTATKHSSLFPKSPESFLFSSSSASQSMPIFSQRGANEMRHTTSEKSSNDITGNEKSDLVVDYGLKPSKQSEAYSPSISHRSPALAQSSGRENVAPISTPEIRKPMSIINESSSFQLGKSPESPLSAGTVSQPKLFTNKTPIDEVTSSSSTQSSVPVTSSAPQSFIFKPASVTSSSASSTGLSTSSDMKKDATQPSLPESSSFLHSSSTTSLSSSTTSVATVTKSSEQEISKFGTKTDDKSTPLAQLVSFTQPQLPSGAPLLISEQPGTSKPDKDSSTGSPKIPDVLNIGSTFKPEAPSPTPFLSATAISSSGAGINTANSEITFTQEDEMEEEAPETTELTLGNLGGFGIGPAPTPAAPKPNPFGGTFGNTATNPPVSAFNMTVPSGGLFRPPSFNIPSSVASQPTSFGAFSGGFSSGPSDQSVTGKGFGQPAQIGSGQQALGSVLGAFGQSRQLGAGLPGNVATPSAFGSGFGGNQSIGGFSSSAPTSGGFAAASANGGFAGIASASGGFGAMASAGGGFAAAATGGGGFAAGANAGGGFAAAATGGGGFSGGNSGGGFPAAGGFGAFSNQGGSGAFSAFGGTGGAARPPSELFTQIRK